MPGISRKKLAVSAVAALLLAGGALSSAAAPAASAAQAKAPASAAPGTHTLTLPNGSTLTWTDDGSATVTSKAGTTRALPTPRSAGRSGFGATYGPTELALMTRATSSSFELGATPAANNATANNATAQITPMNTGPVFLPSASQQTVNRNLKAAKASVPETQATSLPANGALGSSFDSYLNAQGVDAVGMFADDAKYLKAMPGAGEIITNVSVGDLTDQSMADAGDTYVQENGPTTIIENGQRYLDIPTLPLIPTYVASSAGTLDPTGSTEGQDPSLGEVLLDFSMMAPLPDADQRAGATGSGDEDLLGIAPGASYRLVVPQDPDTAGIAAALLAAANQKPRPSVITASLGFGTDEETGFPGRFIEDDATIRGHPGEDREDGHPRRDLGQRRHPAGAAGLRRARRRQHADRRRPPTRPRRPASTTMRRRPSPARSSTTGLSTPARRPRTTPWPARTQPPPPTRPPATTAAATTPPASAPGSTSRPRATTCPPSTGPAVPVSRRRPSRSC